MADKFTDLILENLKEYGADNMIQITTISAINICNLALRANYMALKHEEDKLIFKKYMRETVEEIFEEMK